MENPEIKNCRENTTQSNRQLLYDVTNIYKIVGMNREELLLIAEGQQQRTVVTNTMKQYISKCRVITKVINEIIDIREEALELNPETGDPISHRGAAVGVLKMKFPISVDIAKILFAKLSVDDSLPRKRRQ